MHPAVARAVLRVDPLDHIGLVLVGLAAGLLGGCLGIGGSVIMIPAMHILLGPAQHIYQGAAMIVNLFVVVPSVVQHRRAGLILGPVVRATIPAALLGVVLGVWISDSRWFHGANEIRLARIFGLFLLYEAAYNVYRLGSGRVLPDMGEEAAAGLPWWRTTLLVGLPTGLIAGLLGVGGGVLAVPLQQLVLRVPLRRAIANSAATIIVVSLVGATYKNLANARAGLEIARSLQLAGVLIPTAMVGGYFGARLTHVLPRRALRAVLVVLLLYCGMSLLKRCEQPAAGGLRGANPAPSASFPA